MLAEVLSAVLPGPALISAGEASAKAMASLAETALPPSDGVTSDAFFTSDDPTLFRREAARFLGAPPDAPVFHVDIEKY